MTLTDQEVRMTCAEFQALPLHVDVGQPKVGQRWKVDLPRPVHSRACACRVWVDNPVDAISRYGAPAPGLLGRYEFSKDCRCVSDPATACEACRFKARWGAHAQKKRPNWYLAEYVENPHNSTFVVVKYRRLIVRLESTPDLAIADATGVPYKELTA